ncbi:MAG: uridylate kinase [Methylomonas sp.]
MITVIKLGGSLLQGGELVPCLDAVEQLTGQKIIVPGGGLFADQVRAAQACWQFDDRAAHQMAILAMQQMALLLQSLKPRFALMEKLDTALPEIGIWLPVINDLDQAEIAASWDITSDSLAAWLAGRLNAEQLILIKSAEIDPKLSLEQLQQQGIIDAAFGQFAESLDCPIRVIHKHSFISSYD